MQRFADVDPDVVTADPEWQPVQLDWPVFSWKFPALQLVQELAEASDEYFPETHVEQLEEPMLGANVPTPQTLQTSDAEPTTAK